MSSAFCGRRRDPWRLGLRLLDRRAERLCDLGVKMPVFGRNRRSSADPRMIAKVEEQDECWRVAWLGHGENKPPDYEAASLTEVTDLATARALAVYAAAGRRPPDAVLTFAIYPRGHGASVVFYEISGSPGQFKARYIEDGTRQVQAPNLDELVAAVRQQAGVDYAMLGWVRPMAELRTKWLEQ
jgi:hypothetical protein